MDHVPHRPCISHTLAIAHPHAHQLIMFLSRGKCDDLSPIHWLHCRFLVSVIVYGLYYVAFFDFSDLENFSFARRLIFTSAI